MFLSFTLPGKVHGSLARAGKVRGQTPKVSVTSPLLLQKHSGGTLPSAILQTTSAFTSLYNDAIPLLFLQVDKQEKKKKKTGRAKRRIQYNRRFVNVVPTFGKKKGPNANS